jgi:hypothetical protein
VQVQMYASRIYAGALLLPYYQDYFPRRSELGWALRLQTSRGDIGWWSYGRDGRQFGTAGLDLTFSHLMA